ncbi:hypothetical protein, partial [Xanthomonas euvesicatoria]|uniref:hypothetical protein n=1 Tax=Xanthomonas euvesicatoria TaxID=456327 RepID=UPI00187D9990
MGRINAIAVQRIGERGLKPAARRRCRDHGIDSRLDLAGGLCPRCHPGANGLVRQRIEIRPLPSNFMLVVYSIPSLFFVIFAGVMNTRLMQS